jgi:hypothetical protein
MNAQVQRALENRIEAFAREITTILQSAVADAVGDALASRGGGSVARGAGGRKLSSRSARIRDDAEALLREVKKHSGLRMEQIAKNMGLSNTKPLVAPMRFLLKEKKVKRAGQARGTTYRAA